MARCTLSPSMPRRALRAPRRSTTVSSFFCWRKGGAATGPRRAWHRKNRLATLTQLPPPLTLRPTLPPSASSPPRRAALRRLWRPIGVAGERPQARGCRASCAPLDSCRRPPPHVPGGQNQPPVSGCHGGHVLQVRRGHLLQRPRPPVRKGFPRLQRCAERKAAARQALRPPVARASFSPAHVSWQLTYPRWARLAGKPEASYYNANATVHIMVGNGGNDEMIGAHAEAACADAIAKEVRRGHGVRRRQRRFRARLRSPPLFFFSRVKIDFSEAHIWEDAQEDFKAASDEVPFVPAVGAVSGPATPSACAHSLLSHPHSFILGPAWSTFTTARPSASTTTARRSRRSTTRFTSSSGAPSRVGTDSGAEGIDWH